MSQEAIRRTRYLHKTVEVQLTSTQHHVLLALSDFAVRVLINGKPGEHFLAWPSQPTIAKVCFLARSSVKRSLQHLEEVGLIAKDGRVGQMVRYRLHLPPVPPVEDA